MPRRCTVCAHPKRAEIDRALVRSAAYRRIAADYGLSERAVRRHRATHVPRLLEAAREREERTTAARLLAELERLRRVASRLGKKAERKGDLRTALAAVGELRGLVAVALRGLELAELEERIAALEAALQMTPNGRTA